MPCAWTHTDPRDGSAEWQGGLPARGALRHPPGSGTGALRVWAVTAGVAEGGGRCLWPDPGAPSLPHSLHLRRVL